MDKLITDGVKVNSVICDIPYGTTTCSWDEVIPFDEMWDRIDSITYDNAPIQWMKCLLLLEKKQRND